MTYHWSARRVTFVLLTSLMGAAVSTAPAAHRFEWYNGQWAHETGEIKPDETVAFGRLPNGFRWAAIPNANPKGRVAVRLAVQAGSLMEEPENLGAAHYLEHMAFNGSENFPAGSLIPFFQKHGMDFGGDTNAYTSLGQTVYEMNLATNDEAALVEGFRILRDIADKLTISPKEVEEERGIIFSEKRARENENVLANREWRDFLYEGTGYANNVIGTDETIAGLDAAKLRRFYEKWYVPGRMALVVAGEVDKGLIEKLVAGIFGDMKCVPLPAVPEVGEADREGVKFFVQKRPVAMTNVVIEVMHPERPVIETEERARMTIIAALVEKALHRRLFQRIEKEPAVWTGGYFRDGRGDNYSPSIVMSATTAGGDWKKTLRGLQEELLRAVAFGLTEAELAEMLDEEREALKRHIVQASRRTNGRVADQFVESFIAGTVYTSAVDDLARFERVAATLRLDEVNRWIREGFRPENRRIKVSGNIDLTVKEVEDYWETLADLKPDAPDKVEKPVFPYLALPPAAEPVTLKQMTTPYEGDSLVYYRGRLTNGTLLILQPLAFEKGTVSVSCVFGEGLMGVEDDRADVPRFAMSVLGLNGLGKYSTVETARLFRGRGLSVSEAVLDQFNYIGGKAQSADLTTLLEALWTQFRNPVLTEVNRERAEKFFRQTDYFRENDVSGVLRAQKGPFFSGSLNRLKSLSPADVEAVSMEAMRAYLKESRERGPRLIMVSGDFDLETANRWANRLFGSIDIRSEERLSRGLHPVFPTETLKRITVKADRSGKAVIAKAWHADLTDVNDRYRLQARKMAADIANERLREHLREELGAAYSPFAYYVHQPEHRGFGYLLMQVETKKDLIGKVEKALDSIVKSLLTEGVTKDELERLRKPMKTAWLTGRKTNQLWEALLLTTEAMSRPYLGWHHEAGRAIDRLTVEDVNREVKAIFAGRRTTLEVTSGE